MIVNLTQHPATDEQRAVDVVDLPPESQSALRTLLTFDEAPDVIELRERADKIAWLAKREHATKAMIGGAPFFMSTLEQALLDVQIRPVYAFSRRVSVEAIDPISGEVEKRSVFRHEGFVPEARDLVGVELTPEQKKGYVVSVSWWKRLCDVRCLAVAMVAVLQELLESGGAKSIRTLRLVLRDGTALEYNPEGFALQYNGPENEIPTGREHLLYQGLTLAGDLYQAMQNRYIWPDTLSDEEIIRESGIGQYGESPAQEHEE